MKKKNLSRVDVINIDNISEEDIDIDTELESIKYLTP